MTKKNRKQNKLARCTAAAIIAMIGLVPVAAATNQTNEIIPLIVMDDVPLDAAILNLAHEMEFNCILDPCVPGSIPGPGSKVPSPSVSIHFKDKTAESVMRFLLKTHNLIVVSNPVTTVARIVPKDHHVKPIPASQVASDSNGVLPTLFITGVTLVEVIETIAKAANLKVSFDSKFSKSEYGRDSAALSIRWTNLTARQALAALLDNYDLQMTEDPVQRLVRISLKSPAVPGEHGKVR